MDEIVVYFIMNNTQKWFIVVAVGCISTILIALIRTNWETIFDISQQFYGYDPYMIRTVTGFSNWTGCVLSGMVCSSITGFFLFKDKK